MNMQNATTVNTKLKDNFIRVIGWAASLMLVSGGIYILFPRIILPLTTNFVFYPFYFLLLFLGALLVYAGIRVFNFSTFEKYRGTRHKFAAKWLF